jgi:hypothetical protein
MAGRGTGSPNYFHCMAWRRENASISAARINQGRARLSPTHTVELTGRTEPYYGNKSNLLPRMTRTRREYRCLTCGYVGWSAHKDLERMEARG